MLNTKQYMRLVEIDTKMLDDEEISESERLEREVLIELMKKD